MLIKDDYLRYPGSKVYFTEADPSSQILYSIRRDEFSVKLKLWLLLADHVVLSTGHMIRSDMTHGWLHDNQDIIAKLSDEKAILPSLSDKYESYTHFATDQILTSKGVTINKKEIGRRSRLLDNMFSSAITWSSEGESNLFREMLAKNIKDRTSPLGRRMVGISNQCLDRFSKAITDTQGCDRGRLHRLVKEHNLYQNYPNPFNSITKIKYTIPQPSFLSIQIFDVLGKELETLINKEQNLGTYELPWNAKNLPSGVYFYRIQTESFTETKSMVLMK